VVTLLAVLGVLVVLFGCAAVATRDGEVLVDAPPDRADLALPAGPLQARDLGGVRFGMALRGYRMAQVDEVLDRLGAELHARDDRLRELEDALAGRQGEAAAVPGATPGPVETSAASSAHGSVAVPASQGAGPAASVGVPASSVAVPAAPVAVPAPAVAVPAPDGQAPAPDEQVPPLPDVEVRPGAEPPAPVPFPEPVHTDEPTVVPPGAAAPEQGTGLLGRLARWRDGRRAESLRR